MSEPRTDRPKRTAGSPGAGDPGGQDVEVRLLGDVELVVDGVATPLGGNKQRLVLAVLALSVGRVVSLDRFGAALWDGTRTPVHLRRTVQTYVARLRQLLGAPLIRAVPGGYQLDLLPDAVDLYRFRRLVAAGETEPGVGRRKDRLDEALSLVRGVPLGGVHSDLLDHEERPRLEEELLEVRERRIDLDLTRGAHDGLVAQLRGLAGAHPFRESLWARLLVALDHCGRRAEALAVYETVRRRLRQELGADPGAPLRRLHAALLDGVALNWPDPGEPRSSESASPFQVPRQLPAAAPMFTGRAAELAELDGPADAAAVVITAIDGMAGVGKTALAVQAARRVAGRYPDGQIFVDLRGYARDTAPVRPDEALEQILRALGVPGERIPPGLDERSGLCRTRLADRKVLMVLDNVATEDQVTPLLPGASGCLVLITSRRRLAGLEHTQTVSLDVLPLPDAVSLFTRIVGERRLADQPPALVAETVELCGRLPLAIRLAAARLRSHPSWTLEHLADRLREHQHRLAELRSGQRSVTAALDLSYQQLTADEQRAYRLLGLHPGPDIDTYASAALIDATVRSTRGLLDELLDAHLLQEPVPGRYVFHDLVRAHANDAARACAEADQRNALTRLLDYYRHTAAAAGNVAYPYGRERTPRSPAPDTPTPRLAEPGKATTWLDDELPNLLAATSHAADHDWRQHAVHLSSILHLHLCTRGRYTDAEVLHRNALAAAGEIGDRAGELDALICLGYVLRFLRRFPQGVKHYQAALALARTISDRAGELDARNGIAQIHMDQGEYREAADYYRETLAVARAIGHRNGELSALWGIGQIHLLQGEYQPAADHFRQGLDIARAIGDRGRELSAFWGIGQIHLLQGEYRQAADHYQQTLDVARAIGHRSGEHKALCGLGHIHLYQDEHRQAADYYRQGLDIARAIGDHNGELSALWGLGQLCLHEGEYRQAAGHYHRCLDLARQTGDRNYRYEGLQGLGRLHLATGRPDDARTFHEQALTLAIDLEQPADQARAHDGLAHAYRALDQPRHARRHWRQALEILTKLGTDHTEERPTNVPAIRAQLAGLEQLPNATANVTANAGGRGNPSAIS